MKYRTFGNTDVKLSAVGLGCMGMSTSYGTPDDKESLKTLQLALELGINYWDTADCYAGGRNEELISNVLKDNRDKVFISTKFGFRYNENGAYVDASPKWMREAVEGSLKRLKTDYIDLYYAHRVDPNIPVEETVGAMAELVKEGKVRYIGLSECNLKDLKKANSIHSIAAVQSEYSLVERQVEANGILKTTKERGSAFVAFAPMGRGLITNKLNMSHLSKTDFRYNIPRYNGEHRENNEKLAAALGELAADKFGATAAQLAIAWLLSQSEHIIPIPGTKHRKYLEENAKTVDIELTEADLSDIKAILEKYQNIGTRYAAKEASFVKK